MEKIFEEIRKERRRQYEKWGEQNHRPLVWTSILGEEYGAVCKEALESNFEMDDVSFRLRLENYRRECIQVAAVAVAMLECLERNKC